jgi:DNA polymerase I-like protein with 3'-5' exonuclease and polymerase domains
MSIYTLGTLEDVKAKLLDKPLMFDTETDGFYGRIELAQFYQKGWDQVILVRRPDPFELAILLLPIHHVMHNASYDVSTIQAQSGVNFVPPKIEDTLYLSRLKYFNKHKFSLDNVMTYVLGYDPYEREGLDKTALQKSNWKAPALSEDQKLYAALDVYHLVDVWEACQEHTEDFIYKLDMLSLGYALDFQQNGFPVDDDAVSKLYTENLKRIEELAIPINVNSYQQVRPYIGSNESDALGLAKLTIQGNERAKNVNEARKLLKTNSFLTKFDSPDSRIYGKFAPSARSGRFTCKDQNLQQLPRVTKGCFATATDSGRCLVYSDYPGLELRAACAVINEPAMEKLLREKADIHNYVASLIFGANFTPTQRQIAKTCNFNLLYGGGWKMLQAILIKDAGILIPDNEIQSVVRKWKNLWKAIKKWQERGASDWRHGKVWSTPLGRKYVGNLMTDQLNIQISGFGAEVAKLAIHYMAPKIKKIEDAFLVNFQHDSYIAECDIKDAPAVAKIIGEAMQEAWFEACKAVAIKDLPMPIEVTWGYNWKGIESGNHLGKLEIR